jgi:hypothetical protein
VRDSLLVLLSMTRVSEVATADDALVAKGKAHELTEILSKRGSNDTNLAPVVKKLLGTYDTIIVLTDSDGAETLNRLRSRRVAGSPFSRFSGNLQLLVIRK